MAKTAVGLFENSSVAETVALDLKATGIAPDEVRILTQPLDMQDTGVLSTPHTDYAAALLRELTNVGAKDAEARAYVAGVRRGGALVFATGSDAQVDSAAEIMNRRNAADVEEVSGSEPKLPIEPARSKRADSALSGRDRASGGGARIFVW